MTFWLLYYHLVWATKGREAVIDRQAEDLIVRSMQATCSESGVKVHAFSAMPDHVHAVMSIPPKVAVSDLVQSLKGTTSRRLNGAIFRPRNETFAWQPEYGVVSFGGQSLERVVAYVNNRAQHHSDQQIWPIFEQIERLRDHVEDPSR